MTPDVNCVMAELPSTMKAYTIPHRDGTYTILLNSRHTYEQHLISYHHEMKHITNGDYERNSADMIELHARGLK